MKKAKFTLIEVIIATLILALSAAITAEMTSRTHLQSFDSEKEWAREHLLSMGCEYYLLFGHEAEFPADLLPSGFSLTCDLELVEIPEDADPEKYEAINGWILANYVITLLEDGNEIDELQPVIICKMVPEDFVQ